MPDSSFAAETTRRLLAPLALVLFVLLALYGLSRRIHPPDAGAPPIAPAEKAPGGAAAYEANLILGVEVYHEVSDELVLDVEYVYTGDHGREAFLGAITLKDGASTGHWAYVPARLLPGRHRARLDVRMNQEAPDEYTSDAIEFEFYVPRKSPFFKETVPFAKMWRRTATP